MGRKRRFFDRLSGLTVANIISLTGAECPDAQRLSHLIADVAPLDLAGPNDLTFIESGKYADALATTRVGACLMPQRFESRAPDTLSSCCARSSPIAPLSPCIGSFTLTPCVRPSLFESSAIAQGAIIHPTARLESGVTVDPGAVIGPRAEIGAGSIISATAVIGPDVLIGRDCTIGAGSSIVHALIGDRVVIHPGCHIGQDGFGYIDDEKQQKIPQTGRVVIQTTSRSVPEQRSIAAASGTRSLERQRRSTIFVRLATTWSSVAIALSLHSQVSVAA